jgi:hypothetical protein
METHADIRVISGEISDAGVFTLSPGGILTGRVIDASGQPIAQARVSVVGGSGRFMKAAGSARPQTSVVTGNDGSFRFDNLKNGSISLRVRASGFVDMTTDPVNPATLDGDLEVVLEVGGVIVGTVINQSRRPVARQKVYLKGQKRSLERTTDPEGRFTFDDLPTGEYTVRTFTYRKSKDDPNTDDVQTVAIRSGETIEVTLQKREG